ncbi:hypothetical protein Mjas_05670 [Methanothermococcus sp. Ax23]|uniref:hypothetical protein n=1 Tax=Methanothermococcus sp. Ax23 TaxID=3156486 RepID=UPI003B9EBB47
MDIDEVLSYLFTSKKKNFNKTKHYETRLELREEDLPDEEEILKIITENKPVGILKQKDGKFKVYYENSEEHDIVVVISVKCPFLTEGASCFTERACHHQ